MLFINSFRTFITIFAAALLVTVKISVLFDGSVMDHGPLKLSVQMLKKQKRRLFQKKKTRMLDYLSRILLTKKKARLKRSIMRAKWSRQSR